MIQLKQLDLTFDEAEHRYTLNGNWVPGTTTIIKAKSQPWLAPWMLKMAIEHVRFNLAPGVRHSSETITKVLQDAKSAHRRKSDKAKDIGSAVHERIKAYISGKEIKAEDNEAIISATESFWAWEREHKVEWLMSEFMVASEKHRYAGTVDFLAQVDGQLVIGDFKTSARISEDHYLQTAAYLNALMEMMVPPFPSSPIARAILRIPKDGGSHEFRILETDLSFDIDAFLALRRVHQWNNYIEKHQQEATT